MKMLSEVSNTIQNMTLQSEHAEALLFGQNITPQSKHAETLLFGQNIMLQSEHDTLAYGGYVQRSGQKMPLQRLEVTFLIFCNQNVTKSQTSFK